MLFINGIQNRSRGPSFWTLSSSLLDDKEYVSLINMKNPIWNDEFKEVKDLRLFWDLMKCRIHQESIAYSKLKAKERGRSKMAALESKLNDSRSKNVWPRSFARKYEHVRGFEDLAEFELQND